MKRIVTFIIAAVVAVSASAENYYHVLIGDLYYNLDATTQTAEVTSQNEDNPYWSATITTANIPSSVTYNSVTYSVTRIGFYAFYECSGLTSVTIPNSVTNIGDEAFFDCNSLTSVTIPNSVISIGGYAFFDCNSLTSVTIPNSVISIGALAFCGCSGLTTITIPNSVTSIGELAFFECAGLKAPVYNAHVFAHMPTSYSGAYTIQEGIKSIIGGAFGDCSSLTSITIPNSVISIDEDAFFDCSSLSSIVVANGNTKYDSRGNCNAIIETATNTLIAGCQNTIIPNSVTSIGVHAFSGCSGFTTVTIPNSVISIETGAFSDCTGLTTITIPNSVTNIEFDAFEGCTGLTSITCEAMTPPSCRDNAFDEVPKSIPLYVPFGSENAYRNAEGWSYFTNVQPIKAENVDITTMVVVPDGMSVNIAWPKVSGAASYELVIKDKNGQVVCTLIFDAEGRLLSIAFNAPGRRSPNQTQTAGFSFTVTGLENNTSYDLTITAKNGSGTTLDQKTTSFTTGTNAIDQITNDQSQTSNKFIHNGHLYILRDGKTYTVQGQEIK